MAITVEKEPEEKEAAEEAAQFDTGWNDPEFKKEDEEKTEETEEESEEDESEEEKEDEEKTEETEEESEEEEEDEKKEKPEGYTPGYKDVLDKMAEHRKETKEDIDRLTSLKGKPSRKKRAPESHLPLNSEKYKAKLEKIRETDPDVADAVGEIVEDLTGHINARDEELNSLRMRGKKQDAQSEISTERNKRLQTIEEKHPGFMETAKTGEFQDWLGKNPFAKKILEGTESPADIIEIFDTYKAYTPPETEEEEEKKEKDEEQQEAESQEAAKKKARKEAAKTVHPKNKAKKAPAAKILSEDEEYDAGWNDPEFN